jgi:hypothetical protein
MIERISVTEFTGETGAELNILTTAHARMQNAASPEFSDRKGAFRP